MSPARISGIVECKHLHDRLGSYGVIKGEDGKHYVFTAGSVYRNRSHAAIGAEVTFEIVGSCASGIDDVYKKPFNQIQTEATSLP